MTFLATSLAYRFFEKFAEPIFIDLEMFTQVAWPIGNNEWL